MKPPVSRRLVVAGVAAAFVPRVARAHTFPSRLSVQVQAERDAAVVMITYAPEAARAEMFEVAAAWRGDARARFEATLAEAALDAVALDLDGGKLEATKVSTKLFEQPPRSGRHAVAVLVEKKLDASAHRLEISAEAPLSWVDTSRGRASSPLPPEAKGHDSFSITWKAL